MQNNNANMVSDRASSVSAASSVNAHRRRMAAESLAQQNKALREAQAVIQVTKYEERELSPNAKDPEFFECRLPNQNTNYALSPAAIRARQDGSLDPMQTHFNRTFNRKLKMRDTFTKIFPAYTHGNPTTYIPSNTHAQHFYPRKDDLGNKM